MVFRWRKPRLYDTSPALCTSNLVLMIVQFQYLPDCSKDCQVFRDAARGGVMKMTIAVI
jgi:hypothetical protein